MAPVTLVAIFVGAANLFQRDPVTGAGQVAHVSLLKIVTDVPVADLPAEELLGRHDVLVVVEVGQIVGYAAFLFRIGRLGQQLGADAGAKNCKKSNDGIWAHG